jgi:hypothetical protein
VAPRKLVVSAVAAAALCVPSIASADVVLDWNRTLVDALYTAKTAPQPGTRLGAIVQTAVFDSVNGITRRYSQFRPDLLGTAPHGASAPAAAAGAAYTALVALFPAQKPTFDLRLAASLAQIPGGNGGENGSQAVVRGLDWGTSVANAILAWRAGDGLNAVLPDYVPGTQPGDWQPQPGIVNPVFRQFATMTPWTMSSPAQFRPAARPSLTDPQYLADLTQVRTLGNIATVTPEHADIAWFWQGKVDTVATLWNRTADSLAGSGDRSITENARIFALLNVALADAAISVWDAKNAFNFWRPITAIQAGGTRPGSRRSRRPTTRSSRPAIRARAQPPQPCWRRSSGRTRRSPWSPTGSRAQVARARSTALPPCSRRSPSLACTGASTSSARA